jgi:FkbM family methyltransferase
MGVKSFVKQVLPLGICEYSVRRHEFMRMGIDGGRASALAVSSQAHEAILETRLNLVPTAILQTLRTCVDAGANAGLWTQTLLHVFRPARVIAVECEPRMLGPLKARFTGNSRVQIIEAALAQSAGTARFHQLSHPAGSSLLEARAEIKTEFHANSWDAVGSVEVPTIGYDQLVEGEQEISILKLDIQGAEERVLAGSSEGLRKTKSIILEVTFVSHYEGDAGFPELHRLMEQKGFGLYRLSAPYHRGGRILYADAVYVREEILSTLSTAP